VNTPIDMGEVKQKLRGLLGDDSPAVDLLTAQIALESDDGRATRGYNVGNRKPVDREGTKYQVFRTWELENGKRVDRNEPFLAHDTLDEGLLEYVKYLDRKGLLDAADSGDVDTFNRALKSKGYYTADETKYGNILKKKLGRTDG